MLYAFYKTYAATGGKAFGDVSAALRTPGHETPDGEPAHTGPQQRRFPQPEIDPAIIYRDPTPIIGRTPPRTTVVPPSRAGRTAVRIPYANGYHALLARSGRFQVPHDPTKSDIRRSDAGTPTNVVQTTPPGSTPSWAKVPNASRISGTPAPLTPAAASGAVFTASATPSQWHSPASLTTPQPYPAEYRVAARAEASAQDLPASRVMRARRPVPPPEGARRSKKRH
ncbi:hypothetical protein HPB51_021310 [Rhipicephalus microplus]|uniref:Uncharacterized protein n=1 Tax=Rhipicephalus microplus TaxID=6941 RepID=A0A9J6F5Z5_RHIMP|nr:hypothetical protein HPB51_021310 [Rhipicephalus microplus]